MKKTFVMTQCIKHEEPYWTDNLGIILLEKKL